MVCISYLLTAVKMSIERVYLDFTIFVRTPHIVFTFVFSHIVINLHYYFQDTT